MPEQEEKKDNKTNFKAFNHVVYPKLDLFILKNQDLFFYITLFLFVLFGILLFDVKISEGGDDSMYLLDAKRFIEGKAFPSFHGIFYSILIGVFIKIFGFHLIVFKALSLLFLLGHHIFFYRTFKNRISPFLLISILLIISINSSLIYFGSQTYTEAFYLFLQSVLFYVLFNYFIDIPNTFDHIQKYWIHYVSLGALLFMLSTTRFIGLSAFLALIIFYIISKKFKPLIYIVLSYCLYQIPYSVYKRVWWGLSNSDLSAQIKVTFQKNPYNNALGNEDLAGMIVRFFENLKIYLSNSLLQIFDLKSADNNESNLFLAIIIVSILLFGLILSFKKENKLILPVFLYMGISFIITFLSLHQLWGQPRLIIIYIPLFLTCLFWIIVKLSDYNKLSIVKYFSIILISLITIKELPVTLKKAQTQKKILAKNIQGNKYYGYTPDMAHFLEMSDWAAKNIPENVMIGSRKSSMSFIYGNGREFYGIYNVPYQQIESVIQSAIDTKNEIFFIQDNQLYGKPMNSVIAIQKNLFSLIIFEDSAFGLYLVPKKDLEKFQMTLKQLNINTLIAFKPFKNQYLKPKTKVAAISPEHLLKIYKKNNVHYLISANLRTNVFEKTENTINTVEWIIALLNMKYPGICTKVHQIGLKNDEPASLYKINYQKLILINTLNK